MSKRYYYLKVVNSDYTSLYARGQCKRTYLPGKSFRFPAKSPAFCYGLFEDMIEYQYNRKLLLISTTKPTRMQSVSLASVCHIPTRYKNILADNGAYNYRLVTHFRVERELILPANECGGLVTRPALLALNGIPLVIYV